jgi:hypothetical protein
MTPRFQHALVALLAGALVAAAHAAPAGSEGSAALQAKYTSLDDALKNNPYGRPLVIESVESQSALKGDVYAVVNHPFSTVSASLTGAARWCDVVMLHLNTKFCRSGQGAEGATMSMGIGGKNDTPVEASPVDFAYRVVAATPEYFSVRLNAGSGPMGTRDYRILLEAAPIDGGRTFLHFTYSYGFGLPGRVAMQAYLSTVGANKVGFTRSGKAPVGDPDYIGGMRGVVERNAMRYYLAIDAYLSAAPASPANRMERAMRTWFDSTEQYKRQLYEMDREAYLTMKRRELQRQQVATTSVTR